MSALRSRDARRSNLAFTLIELLVVIAIIALLVAILLPSLEAARRQAKANACLSHIKNIATSSRVYEADDPSGWGIPVHPLQFKQCPAQAACKTPPCCPSCPSPTYIGAYEWGGKAGIGGPGYAEGEGIYGARFGTLAGFGPASRPMNEILYKGGFKDNTTDRAGQLRDTQLDLELFHCPGDDGSPRGAHCPGWIARNLQEPTSSYDWFGNSYAANIFMIGAQGGSDMHTNSPYLRPVSRVPTPARTLYYEENIGRWAWSAKREKDDCLDIAGPGVDPGPTKAIRGWHGKDWSFNRAFVDAHAEYQKIYIEGTEDSEGYALHYVAEVLDSYPSFLGCCDGPDDPDGGDYGQYRCIIVRGQGWQKDTMPAPLLCTGLRHGGGGRPSYERCVGDTADADW